MKWYQFDHKRSEENKSYETGNFMALFLEKS